MSAFTLAAVLVAALALALAAALALARAREGRRAAALARDRREVERAEVERQAALERAVVGLENELVAVYGEVRRVGESRSWRYAHALSRLASTLVGRRPAASDSAVDLLVERLERLELPSDGAPLLARSGADGARRPSTRRARHLPGRGPGSAPARSPAGGGVDVELMVAALGLSESDLDRALELLTTGSGREPATLLAVVDSDSFDLLRQRGCRFEFVPPREDWDRHFPGESYEHFLQARLAELQRAYAPARTLLLGELTEPVVRALALPVSAPAARTPA